jgi:hypothetical protein
MHSAPGVWTSLQTGCPIRILTAHRLHAAPRERFAGLRVLLRPDAPRHPPWTRARLCLLGWGRLLPSRSSTLTRARDTRSPLFLFFLPSIVLLLLLSAKLKLTLSSVVQVHVVEQLRPLNNCEVESHQNTRATLPTALALCPSLCFLFLSLGPLK